MFFQEQVNRLSRWFSNSLSSSPALCGAQGGAGSAAAGRTSISRTTMGGSAGSRAAKLPAAQRTAANRTTGQRRKQTRTALLEAMEPRHMMAADMI
ncbi:MAG: hypothetical protein KDA51_02920, partial [Planctomycetales bacterium]|nr:hypothetical protein [Planctomycetales bacterium]